MGGGEDTVYYNPGSINLENENPELYGEVKNLRDMRTEFRDSNLNALDSNRYAQRSQDAGDRAATRVQNQMSSSGMAGSSAAIGAGMEAQRQNQFAWDDRQLGDQIKAMQMESMLSGQISTGIGNIQGQFANTQNQMNSMIQQQNAQEQQMWGQIIQAGAMVGGTMLAGPAGGAAAGSIAGGLTSGYGEQNNMDYSNWQPQSYGGGGGGYSVGGSNGMYGGNPSAYGYGGY